MQKWMFRTPERIAQVPALVANLQRLSLAFEKAGLPIYDVRTEHKADRSTWSRLMLKYDYPCLLEGTPDADPVEGYCPPSTAKRIIKRANSAFLRTDFEETLERDQVTRLVLSGVFIQGCVGLTAADAAQRGFEVTLVEDAIGHGSAPERAPFFDWLLEDYELECVNTADFLKSFETGGGSSRPSR